MEVPIVDRSPIDMLLSGDYIGREPRPPHHRYKIKSDPSVLPLGYWHKRSQEYRTFNQRKRIDVKLEPAHREHLPGWLSWLPGFIRWPIERRLSNFLGETEQRPLHMRVEVSMPRLTLWLINPFRAAMVYACYAVDAVLLAWFYESTVRDLQYPLLGLIGGLLFGLFLRARQERVFEWKTYRSAFLLSSIVTLGGLFSASRLYDLPLLLLPIKTLSIGLDWYLNLSLLLASLAVCLGPFLFDRLALRHQHDVVLLSLLLLTLLRSYNLWVPVGVWLGGFIKVAPAPVPLEASNSASAAASATALPGSTAPAAAPTTGTAAAPPKPPAPALQDEDLFVKRWRAPVTSPYQGYSRDAYGATRAMPPALSGLASRANATASGGGGGYGGPSASAFGSSLSAGGMAPSSLLTDGRRTTPQRPLPGPAAASGAASSSYPSQSTLYGGGLESSRPVGGTPMRSLLADVEDDEPPPISPAPFSNGGETGLYSRRRSQRQQPAQPAYGMGGGAPLYASGGRRY